MGPRPPRATIELGRLGSEALGDVLENLRGRGVPGDDEGRPRGRQGRRQTGGEDAPAKACDPEESRGGEGCEAMRVPSREGRFPPPVRNVAMLVLLGRGRVPVVREAAPCAASREGG